MGRATWVWTRPPVADLVVWAVREKVDDLHVAVPPGLDRDPALAWCTSLRSAATDAGIRLQALGGDPSWVDDPGPALAWQRDALATGLFDRVHLDVEPWTTPAWRRDPVPVARRWLRMLDLVVEDAGAAGARVEADVPFWLEQVQVDGLRLDRAVVARVAGVTALTYRTRVAGSDGVVDLAAAVLGAGEEAGVPVRLAAETRWLGPGPVAAKQTFHGRSAADLAGALAAVDRHCAGSPAYAGTAVHDHDGWRVLR